MLIKYGAKYSRMDQVKFVEDSLYIASQAIALSQTVKKQWPGREVKIRCKGGLNIQVGETHLIVHS